MVVSLPKGCVLGPLIMAISAYSDEQELKEIGVKDSKLLPHPKRLELAKFIKSNCFSATVVITAEELNSLMKLYSLNEIEAIKTAELIDMLPNDVEEVVVDSPDAIPKNYARRIRKYTKKKIKITSENKADFNHPIVGAASIMAKVERENQIDKIKKIVGCNFGSGYSSDQVTTDFLKKNFENEKLLPYIRLKWITYRNLVEGKLQGKLF